MALEQDQRSEMTQSLPQFSYKGANYTFVDSQRKFLDELKCPICLELVSDPVQTSCGHLFCGKCIKETETCPVDRKTFTSTPDYFNSRRLNDFKVKCPNFERGCSWQGELREAEEHIGEICCYQMVKCKNGCKKEMERRQLRSHETTKCLHRNFKCPHCPHRGPYNTVTTSHLTVCESFRLPCVAGCKRTLTRRGMKDHLANTCSEELVECPHKMAGCASIVKRKDLEEHTSDKDHHLQALMKSYAATMQHLYEMINQSGLVPDASILPLAFCPWLQNTPTCYPQPPCVLKMEGFQEKKKNNKVWRSDPVYSHIGGYKMCLKVHANGSSDAKGTYLSLFISLMRGDNDDNLKWPFKGTIKVSLLNQLEDGQHNARQPWSSGSDVSEDASSRVTGGERAGTSWGRRRFISHQDLCCNGNNKLQYLKDNTLFFRVDSFEPMLD